MIENVRESLKAGNYEVTPEGVVFPVVGVCARGVFSVAKRGEPEEFSENVVVNEGLDYILKAAIGETAGVSNWYIALFEDNVTPNGATWNASFFEVGGGANEWTNYTPSARPTWTPDVGGVTSQAIDSFSSKASFTSTADGQVIYGAGMLSASAKNASSGILLAASKFPSSKGLDSGEILDVGYGLQLSAV